MPDNRGNIELALSVDLG